MVYETTFIGNSACVASSDVKATCWLLFSFTSQAWLRDDDFSSHRRSKQAYIVANQIKHCRLPLSQKKIRHNGAWVVVPTFLSDWIYRYFMSTYLELVFPFHQCSFQLKTTLLKFVISVKCCHIIEPRFLFLNLTGVCLDKDNLALPTIFFTFPMFRFIVTLLF